EITPSTDLARAQPGPVKTSRQLLGRRHTVSSPAAHGGSLMPFQFEASPARRRSLRRGTAAVEFAACLPFFFLVLYGLGEVGRITEVQNVVWNSGREAARDASLGQDNLSVVADNLRIYLQSAEPTAFGAGHATQMISPVISLPPNTYGFTCWDTVANREL